MRDWIDPLVKALDYEIEEVGRRGRKIRIELWSGRPRDQASRSRPGVSVVAYQSAFDGRLPDDAVGTLITPAGSYEATVIEAIPGSVILAVEHPHGSLVDFSSARFEVNSTALLELLRGRLIGAASGEYEVNWDLLEKVVGKRRPRVGIDEDAIVDGLSSEQAEAVRLALGSEVLFLQGPPGTGKTRTIGNIVRSAIADNRSILVASHTHVAVDQALLSTLERADRDLVGVVYRLGEPRIDRVPARFVALNGSPEFDAAVTDAPAVFATLSKRYVDPSVLERKFDIVLIDEASMASPALALPALGGAQQAVILVGDPHQLPPIVQSEDKRAREWLGRDLFDRCDVSQRSCFAKLTEQRRMRPEIADICRLLRYDGDLVDHPSVTDRDLTYLPAAPLGDAPRVLIDSKTPRGTSVIYEKSHWNLSTALAAIDIAIRLAAQMGVSGKDERPIGIIAPYSAQRRLLVRLADAAGILGEVLPGTIHTFQGNETSIVLFDSVLVKGDSNVRLMSGDEIDATTRDMNVAVSRARDQFAVVGNIGWLRIIRRKCGLGQLMEGMEGADRIDWVRSANSKAWVAGRDPLELAAELHPRERCVVVGHRRFVEAVASRRESGCVAISSDAGMRPGLLPHEVRWIPWEGNLPNMVLSDAGIVGSVDGERWIMARGTKLGALLEQLLQIGSFIDLVADLREDLRCGRCSSPLVARYFWRGKLEGRRAFVCPKGCKGSFVVPERRRSSTDVVGTEERLGPPVISEHDLERERNKRRFDKARRIAKHRGGSVRKTSRRTAARERTNSPVAERRVCVCGSDYPAHWQRCPDCGEANPEILPFGG